MEEYGEYSFLGEWKSGDPHEVGIFSACPWRGVLGTEYTCVGTEVQVFVLVVLDRLHCDHLFTSLTLDPDNFEGHEVLFIILSSTPEWPYHFL